MTLVSFLPDAVIILSTVRVELRVDNRELNIVERGEWRRGCEGGRGGVAGNVG